MSVKAVELTRQFAKGDAPAVRKVNFTAPSGAITTLLGPSGSGKTTALRLIAGLEVPDGGRVEINGEDTTGVPVQKRGVGFVFQGYALFEHRNARSNIAFGLEIQKVSKSEIRRRTDELLELVQLGDMGDRYPSELSGGQRQRVAFARALATRPKVLLLDEPFGALDSRVRVELREWLHALHTKLPITTVLVTHDQEEALELSEQIVVMNQGCVEQCGTPHDIYDNPATQFVASFIGNANAVRSKDGDGKAAIAYVRPHEIRIMRADEMDSSAQAAVVESLTRVGGFIKVTLKLKSGEPVNVQLLRAEADRLGLAVGSRVRVDLGDAKVFAGDYAI
jgi:sulfate/thiosulfate transport system ATP-binding protein